MIIQDVPEVFIKTNSDKLDLFIHDFKMTDDVFKSKVNLSLHMFSFLQKGKKHVHFADSFVMVDYKQSLLLKKGNCLWSELLDNDDVYYCKLFFFSDSSLRKFLEKYSPPIPNEEESPSHFVIENDDYIHSYLDSLSTIANPNTGIKQNLLSIKFEELMLYLIHIYGNKFENYLHSLTSSESYSFRKIIDNNVYSNLKINEIAFLCHMSLSTFKRNFIKEYNTSPGKWFQDKRLKRAKTILEKGELKPSDIYLDFGYNNLSNFSIAFKNKFGKSPNLLEF